MKITTLIPGYKKNNIKNLISGLANQTLRPYKIIISDDSKDLQFTYEFVNSIEYSSLNEIPIEFYNGPQTGAYENFKHLIKIWNHQSELVHLMLDDDFIYPSFYEKHRLAHSAGKFSCSISSRWSANSDSIPIKQQDLPNAIKFSREKIISLSEDIVFLTTISECKNWLGEFSNAVMHESSCDLLFKPELAGINYSGLWDLGYFINASQKNPIAYINEYLGFFRLGGESNSSKTFGPHMKAAFLAYAALTRAAKKLSKIDSAKEIENYANLYKFLKFHYSSQQDILKLTQIIQAMTLDSDQNEGAYLELWNQFLSSHKL